MPFTLTLDHTRRQSRIVWTPPTSPATVLESLNELVVRGAWPYGTLNDCRAVLAIPTTDTVRAVLAQATTLSRAHGRRGPVAFVVANHEALYGMLRMYALLGEAHVPSTSATKVFVDLETASTWLDAAAGS